MTGAIINFAKKHGPLLFAAAGTVVVLWQMLLPGYVLTWDMIFGPAHVFPALSGLLNGLPLQLLLYGAGFLMPMWAVQKILLISLFFLLFYLPILFFPLKIDTWARYAAAALYAVNPFVYERFLAGQLDVLYPYALLAPFLYFLLNIIREPRMRTAVFLALTMILIGFFSLHAFVMAVLIASTTIALVTVLYLCTRDAQKAAALALHACIAAAIVCLVSLYWVVPFLLSPQSSPLPQFTQVHWQVFETSTDLTLGAPANVLMLYGFWGEQYPWMHGLFSPKSTPTVFFPALLALLILIFVGAVASIWRPENRSRTLLIIGIAAVSCIVSLGLAPSYFHGLNVWLFEHVYFWRGFRDTEKWSMWLALSFAYLYAAGASHIMSAIRPKLKLTVLCALVLLPLIYTYTMLGGFAGQLRAVNYPASWYQVNATLEKDPNCTALFLPWHEYYWLSFDDKLLTANTAPSFFDCAIISSRDAEIGDVGDQGADPTYEAIAQAVTYNNRQDIDKTLATFRKEGIRYIIYTDDLVGRDPYTYPFLRDKSLQTLYTSVEPHLVLIKL